MIEPKELRIGNWVNVITKDNPVQIDGIKRQKVKDGYYYSVLIDGEYYLPENLNGIPLTPKILEKCGFENKHAEYCEHYKKDKILIEIIPDGTYQARLEYDSSHSLWLIELASLHQLQNLYLDLTGEEIEINL